ncbi:hypothetical protein BGZ94_005840 [Podila epigama]|nr:hypothetical protein BGZ94_005840 [Podila epigama]
MRFTVIPSSRRIIREWPRHVVGLFAIYGFFSRACRLFYVAKHMHSLDEIITDYTPGSMSPEQETVWSTILVVITGIIAAAYYILVLYSAVRRSLQATKAALLGWAFGMALEVLNWAHIFWWILADAPSPEEGERQIGRLLLQMLPRWIMDVFFGWSLIVWLRDQRGQERNIFGILRTENQYLLVHEEA